APVGIGAIPLLAANQALLSATYIRDTNCSPVGPQPLTWTKVSGPGSATFTNANTAQTIVTMGTPGEYVFRFTAADCHGAASNMVTVCYVPTNEPPTIAITSPTNNQAFM